mmetsp:Transcript_5679/g.25626  ORF Transcript_5679/g.25626 Transcript_5679/m.25626 type:complete len:222 (-) Transcript_5679:1384-2049(-)
MSIRTLFLIPTSIPSTQPVAAKAARSSVRTTAPPPSAARCPTSSRCFRRVRRFLCNANLQARRTAPTPNLLSFSFSSRIFPPSDPSSSSWPPSTNRTIFALIPSGSGSSKNPPCCHCGCVSTEHLGHAFRNLCAISALATMSSKPLKTTMSSSPKGPRSHASCGKSRRFISCCVLGSPFTNQDAKTRLAIDIGSVGSAPLAARCVTNSYILARWSSCAYRR